MMDKMRMHALITQLVADGETFDGPAADRLIAEVPVTTAYRRWRVSGAFRRGGHGGGPALASGPADDKARELTEFGDLKTHRVGLYAIAHMLGQLHIRSVVGAVGIDGDGARITYSRARAERMDLSVIRRLQVGPLALELAAWRSWKSRIG
jgi:hypothetical protein